MTILAERVLEYEISFPSDAKLLMGGVKGLKDAWRLGVLHVEYERLEERQEQQQQ